MALPNPLYYAQFPLQEVIYDKTTGDPLAGGIVSYFTNSSMTTALNVYAQSNAPSGEYLYTSQGNVLVLSGIGSFVDLSGNNFIPFLYPYDSEGAFTPYFIYVTDSSGSFQFSTSDWPPNQLSNNSGLTGSFASENQITNPQFAETLFSPALTATINVTTTDQITPIAPGWFIKTSGVGSVALTQNDLTEDIETNAPYSLTITTTGSLTAFSIYQRIFNSPRLYATGAVSGFFEAKSFGTTSVQLTMTFAPSTGGSSTPIPTQICQGSTNFDGRYELIADAAEIDIPINLESPVDGYVDVIITPSVNTFSIALTSIQIVPVAEITDVQGYSEVSVPIQKSLNSYYWLPKHAYKPIPSYLVGWDFALNPFQAQGTSASGPQAFGGNTAYYIADQTILFQTVTSAFTTQKVTAGLQITASAASSFAIIQYVSPLIVQELLSQRMSVQIKCSKTGADLVGTVGLYWTAGVIPTITSAGSYASLFTAITAGAPSLTSGWTKVPNTYPTQSFTATTTSGSTPFSFAGFDATAQALVSTAVNFAIAITFNTMVVDEILTINYCSLVGGDIATRPAPQTSSAVLADCQYYYHSSFPYATEPGANTGGGIYGVSGGASGANQRGPNYTFPTPLRANPTPTNVILFNPQETSSNQIYNLTSSISWSACGVDNTSKIGFSTYGTVAGAAYSLLSVNFVADARLGVI